MAEGRVKTALATPEEDAVDVVADDIYGILDPPANVFSSGCTVLDRALGGGWGVNRVANIVGDKCLSGDTVVSMKRGSKPRKITMKALYERFHGNHFNKNPNLKTELLSDLGGYVGLNEVLDIVKSGKKQLFEVKTAFGSIKASKDHKFWTENGWTCIEDGLSVGDRTYVWKQGPIGRKRKDRKYTYSIPNHPYGQKNVVSGKDYKRLPTCRLVVEADMNGMSVDEFVDVLREDEVRSRSLNYSDPVKVVHHIDGDPTNDSVGNLMLLSKEAHEDIHSGDMPGNVKRTQLAEILSIEPCGEEETYDITMHGPHHNFIANGFVVHNSTGKTLLAIEAAANFVQKFPEGRVIYAEAEAAFDVAYAEKLGFPSDKVDFVEVFTVEEVFKDITSRIEDKSDNVPTLYVIDSMDALSDAKELGRDMDAGTYGTKPKAISEMFRRLNQIISKSNITLMIVSQIRDNIGVTFGKKYKRSGGHAMDFYATHCVWLSHLGRIDPTRLGVKRVIGVDVKAKVEKNKIGPPFREAEFPIYFGYGVEDMVACLKFLVEFGFTEYAGMDDKKAKRAMTKALEMPQEEYDTLMESIIPAVNRGWAEIEARFEPARKKY